MSDDQDSWIDRMNAKEKESRFRRTCSQFDFIIIIQCHAQVFPYSIKIAKRKNGECCCLIQLD